MDDYSGLIRQKLESDDILMALVDGMVYESAPGMLPQDDKLTGPNQACIGIEFSASTIQPLPGVYFHGYSDNNQQIFFKVTVQNMTGRNSVIYANSIIYRIKDLFKSGSTQRMDGIDYQILITSPFRKTSVFDNAFPNRANVKLEMQINYIM